MHQSLQLTLLQRAPKSAMDIQSNVLTITSGSSPTDTSSNGQAAKSTKERIKRSDFPSDFVFGAATASYQV